MPKMPKQVTVYEAGAVQWAQRGTVETVERSTLGTICPTSLTGNDGDRQAFILNDPADVVALEFNGTEIAIYGIAYATDSCQLGKNPTRALLDILAPPPTVPSATSSMSTLSANGPSAPSCVPFSPEAMTCGILLARWTQLDKRNRHRVYITTSGQKIAVLNATVALNLDAPDSQLDSPPSLELPPIPDFKYPSNTTDTISDTLSHFAPSTWPADSSSHRRLHPAQIAMYTLLGVVCALCIIMGLLFARWRMRRRQRTPAKAKPPESEPATQRTSPSPSPAHPPEPHLVEKHQPVKMLFRPPDAMSSANVTLATSDDTDLDRAIEGTGLTKQELIASLNRLRDHGGASRSLARSSSRRSLSPPRYDD
ncbi:hypothetical protein AURDEDRAFT_173322 [Auricularia subglabra TFB-10046 SS5]|uniref:Uncharacterized protein n=1 Tax=Auricularia subglabra (strain TFB-10046 / SS5) TaxID=717982 RepID=J0LHP7_AURST|nr:hypothetical protein AURDEDRAFT_173322 [Auricularia subglabra TFB-10046 SS5]